MNHFMNNPSHEGSILDTSPNTEVYEEQLYFWNSNMARAYEYTYRVEHRKKFKTPRYWGGLYVSILFIV